MKVWILVGVSASGKNTWVDENSTGNEVVVERDAVRSRLITDARYIPGVTNMWLFWKFTKESEQRVTDICDDMIAQAMKNKQDLIINETNLNYRFLQDDIEFYKSNGYEVSIVPCSGDYDEIVRRDTQRVNSVSEKVINKQWLKWIKLPYEINGIKKYVKDQTKPKAILVDIDGTVGFHGTRNPYDWDKVDQDEYIMEVVDMVLRYWDTHRVIFLSGRDSVSRTKTKKWLEKYFPIDEDQLIMRPVGNKIKDAIIKSELFWEYVANDYCVDFVIDDRKQIVRKWTDIGLKVFDVGNIYEEF